MEKHQTSNMFTVTINFKHLLVHRMINWNYLMDLVLLQVFKIILSISLENMKVGPIILLLKNYINKMKNQIVFKINTQETMNFLESNKKFKQRQNEENFPKVDIKEVVLLDCHMVSYIYHNNNKHQKFYFLLYQTKCLDS